MTLNTPAPAEIERIAQLTDPVLRNLQITACYHELSSALVSRTGPSANWCTFATWASRQAGQSIRREDLRRKLQSVLQFDPQVQSIMILLSAIARGKGSVLPVDRLKATAIGHLVEQTIVRSGDAVARGNKKVFEEIGWHFARFLQTCGRDQIYDESSITAFCDELRTGDPPDGQSYLHQAFRRYYQSLFEPDDKKAAELRFWANVEIGFHEQTRLQPEIAEALNAAAVDPDKLLQVLSTVIFPDGQPKTSFGFLVQWVMGKTDVLKRQVYALAELTGKLMRKVITQQLMTLTFPPGNILLLGKDVMGSYPGYLLQLENPDLTHFLAAVDPTQNSLAASGAVDWSDLQERLHFICDLFRCHHEKPELFTPAFTPEQTLWIREGKVPAHFDW